MSLQLIEAYIPSKYFEKIDQKLTLYSSVSYWVHHHSEDKTLIRMVVKTVDSEEILNYLESVSSVIDGFEVMLLPVHSYIKRKHDEDKKVQEQEEKNRLQRASRHELYLHIEGLSKTNIVYFLYLILSAIVVTIGLIKNNSAIVIGGMVIAPLLGPVIALSFSVILGDFKLARQSLVTVFAGIGFALFISIISSFLFELPTDSAEFLSRTRVDILDMVLAIASGAAGALAILNRGASSLVGVMVAVALLPPTVVLGMSVGSFLWSAALGSMLLLFVNINSIVLSAILVFSLSGIRPNKYEEIKKANNSKKYSILFIIILISLLVIAVYYSNAI
jgi:uncharacterized hydrophobic protein (TIGR00341 family)